MLVFEEQRKKLLGQVEPIINEQHQQLVGQLVSELRATARVALSLGFSFHDERFSLVLLLLEGLCELWQERLKLVQIHPCHSQELFGISTKFAIERHRCWKLSLSLAYRATGFMNFTDKEDMDTSVRLLRERQLLAQSGGGDWAGAVRVLQSAAQGGGDKVTR